MTRDPLSDSQHFTSNGLCVLYQSASLSIACNFGDLHESFTYVVYKVYIHGFTLKAGDCNHGFLRRHVLNQVS